MIFFDLLAAAPPAPNPSGGTQLLIAALGAGGISAIIAAVVTGLFSKKKLGSEATEIITRAASGVVTSIEADMARREKFHQEEKEQWQADRAKIMRDHQNE